MVRRAALVAAMVGGGFVLIDPPPVAAASLCGGRTATIVGSAGNDVLNGTPGQDVIAGLAGDDEISGLGGDDVLCGGPGHDVLLGGPGDDWAAYDESATGGALDLKAGTARIQGLDRLAGIENARGSRFADVIRGDDTANELVVGEQDTVEGRGGDDQIGTSLDDFATNAVVAYDSAPGPVTVDADSGDATGAAGHDRLFFVPKGIVGGPYGDRLTCSRTVPRCYVDGRGGPDTISGTPDEDTFRGGPGDDRIMGKGGPDIARYDGSAPVTVNLGTGTATGQGRDTLVGINGAVGGSGNDVLVGGSVGGCFLDAGAGDDRLRAGPAACTLTGGAGDDVITGGPAKDTISTGGEGTGGRDVVHAGPESDLVYADGGGDLLDGGDDEDRVDYAAVRVPIDADLGAGTVITAGLGTDVVQSFEDLSGSAFADTVRGSDGPNRIDGAGGDDTVFGRGGEDYIVLGDGTDWAHGGSGDDLMSGDRGNDTLYGGDDVDTVAFRTDAPGVDADLSQQVAHGPSGFDHITQFENLAGTEGNDVLRGDAGPNLIEGGAGHDTCTGGGGADILRNCP